MIIATYGRIIFVPHSPIKWSSEMNPLQKTENFVNRAVIFRSGGGDLNRGNYVACVSEPYQSLKYSNKLRPATMAA